MGTKESQMAKEMVDTLKPLVYPYLGSGMLSNDYNEAVVLSNAKEAAVVCMSKVIEMVLLAPGEIHFCQQVIKEIKNT